MFGFPSKRIHPASGRDMDDLNRDWQKSYPDPANQRRRSPGTPGHPSSRQRQVMRQSRAHPNTYQSSTRSRQSHPLSSYDTERDSQYSTRTPRRQIRSESPSRERSRSSCDDDERDSGYEDDENEQGYDRPSSRARARSRDDYGDETYGESEDNGDEEDTELISEYSQTSRGGHNPTSTSIERNHYPHPDESLDMTHDPPQRPSPFPSGYKIPHRLRAPSPTSDYYSDTDTDDTRDTRPSTSRPQRRRRENPARDYSDEPNTERRDIGPWMPQLDVEDDDYDETSGEYLPHDYTKEDRRTAETAGSTWDRENRVSKQQIAKHKKRLSDPRYKPSMKDYQPTVSSNIDMTNVPTYKPILRKTDPLSDDLSCYPQSAYKKGLRVSGFHTGEGEIDNVDWSKNHHRKKYQSEEDDHGKAWAPSHQMTQSRYVGRMIPDLLQQAGVEHAPTSQYLMSEDFPTMLEHGLTGLSTELDPDSKKAIDRAMRRLRTVEEREELERDLQEFSDFQLIQNTDLDRVECETVDPRSSRAFYSTDKYCKGEHASDIAQLLLKDWTVVYKDAAARRRALDNGKGIDLEGIDPETISSGIDPVADRDYTTDHRYTEKMLDKDATEAQRKKFKETYDAFLEQPQIKNFDVTWGQQSTAPRLIPYEGQARAMAGEANMAQFRKSMSKAEKYNVTETMSDKEKIRSTNKKNQAINKAYSTMLKTEKHDRKTQYITPDVWKENYSYLSEYDSLGQARTAAEESGDSEIVRLWNRQRNLAGSLNHAPVLSH